jgi:chromosome segregation ATPase
VSNISGLSLLSTEFGFESLTEKLSEFEQLADFRGQSGIGANADVRKRILVLEKRLQQHNRDFASSDSRLSLQTRGLTRVETEVSQMKTAIAGLTSEWTAFRAFSETVQKRISVLEASVSQIQTDITHLTSDVPSVRTSTKTAQKYSAEFIAITPITPIKLIAPITTITRSR